MEDRIKNMLKRYGLSGVNKAKKNTIAPYQVTYGTR
jgi:hypothetical protein